VFHRRVEGGGATAVVLAPAEIGHPTPTFEGGSTLRVVPSVQKLTLLQSLIILLPTRLTSSAGAVPPFAAE